MFCELINVSYYCRELQKLPVMPTTTEKQPFVLTSPVRVVEFFRYQPWDNNGRINRGGSGGGDAGRRAQHTTYPFGSFAEGM